MKNTKRLLWGLIAATVIIFALGIAAQINHKVTYQKLLNDYKALENQVKDLQDTNEAQKMELDERERALEKSEKKIKLLETQIEELEAPEEEEASYEEDPVSRSGDYEEYVATEEVAEEEYYEEQVYEAPSSGYSQTMRVTMYTLSYECCGKYPDDPGYGITASGAYVQEGRTVAAGPGIPFGTRVYIPAFAHWSNGGIFTVEDRGGAVGNDSIDVYVESYDTAINWGQQWIEVQILD